MTNAVDLLAARCLKRGLLAGYKHRLHCHRFVIIFIKPMSIIEYFPMGVKRKNLKNSGKNGNFGDVLLFLSR